MSKKKLPYPDDDDDVIAPDVAPRKDQPIDPAKAIRLEQEKYGEGSADPNRDDQWDAHDQPDITVKNTVDP